MTVFRARKRVVYLSISHIERGVFIKLFVRDGGVLDFTINGLDSFTFAAVGVPICKRYQKPKGKSLTAFLDDCSDEQALGLLNDLMEYYETHFENEFTEGDDDPFGPNYHAGYSEEMASLYRKARAILDRENGGANSFAKPAEYLSGQFSTGYMRDQIALAMEMREKSPTDAIGKAKDLLEACCKTILKETGEEVPNGTKMSQLFKKTREKLGIGTDDMPSDYPGADAARQIVGNLSGLVSGIAHFRNDWGTGHGKAADFEPLSARHAKLAVGCSITLMEYLWDTYLWKKENGRLN